MDLKKTAAAIVRSRSEPVSFELVPTEDPDVVRFVVVTGTAAGSTAMKADNPLARLKAARSTQQRQATGTEVLVSKSWRDIPMCNCTERKRSRMDHEQFCNHVVSILMQNPELQYQLYDMFV